MTRVRAQIASDWFNIGLLDATEYSQSRVFFSEVPANSSETLDLAGFAAVGSVVVVSKAGLIRVTLTTVAGASVVSYLGSGDHARFVNIGIAGDIVLAALANGPARIVTYVEGS